ncbi:LLM class flavin-dependent oxidoreductase [Gordonia sp. CPCC 206044]|uniref:LLM class flavin-dependent oxidoreductase n=1 Tax=Gordonia sp. CPCC 206044 TaxID=3140793 RepID=UPI003AF34E44
MTPTPVLFAEFHHSGDHEGAWRLPSSAVERLADPDYYVERTRIAAGGGFDAVFFADFVGYDPIVRHVVRWPFEPTTLAAALLTAVPDIGVVVTGSTVFATPDQLYRGFATLHDLSGGRIGWNIVTAGAPAAADAIGVEIEPHDRRYVSAARVVEKLTARWSQVGRAPVLAQAGASDAGREFAARHAQVIFTATPDKAAATAFRSDIRRRAERSGRDPDEIRVLPGVLTTIGDSRHGALALRRQLNSLIVDDVARQMLAAYGVEVPAAGLDEPLRGVELDPHHNGIVSRAAVLNDIAADLGTDATWRDLVERIAGNRGHLSLVGTGTTIADVLNEWIDDEACDGFVVKFSHNPGGTEDFVTAVAPHLTARGIGRGAGWASLRRETSDAVR